MQFGKQAKSLLTTLFCTLASIPSPREQACSGPCTTGSDGFCTAITAPCHSFKPNNKHKIFLSPQQFHMRTHAILWCCCAGDRESLLYATETTDEAAVPTHDQNKLKSRQLKVSACLVQSSPLFLAFGELPSGQHI